MTISIQLTLLEVLPSNPGSSGEVVAMLWDIIIIIIIIIISTREVAPSAKAGINGEPQIQVTVNDNRLKIGK